jgi:hypothetical protein
MTNAEMGVLLSNIPSLVSDITYQLMGEMGGVPRFSSVFKLVKEDLKSMGYDYKKLDENEKSIVEEMARDVYDGMKEAGF